MAFQACPGVAEVVVHGTLDGENVYNVLHFKQTPATAWSAAALTTLATAVRAAWVTYILATVNVSYSVLEVSARDLDHEGGESGVAPISTATPGAILGDCLPNNVAVVCTLRTARVGRSYRGRMYIAGIAEADATRSRLVSAAATRFANVFANFNTAMQAITPGDWCVLSRRNQLALRPVGLGEPITSVALRDDVLDTQRRRMPR